MKKISLALSLLWVCHVSAVEQSREIDQLANKMIGTIHAGGQRVSNDGELKGCGMDFIALGRDFSTKRGSLYKAVGSYYFRNVNGIPQFWLKLGVFDINLEKPGNEKSSAIGNAHVASNGNMALKPKLKIDSDSPGFFIYIFESTETAAKVWGEFLQSGKLIIGFNRKAGQQDVTFTFDGTLSSAKVIGNEFIRQQSRDQLDEVGNCTSQLIKTFEK